MQTFDLTKEEPITLAQAARMLPSSHPGKKHMSVRAILRWVQHGHRGTFLEARKFGHTWVTSREALARFSDALAGKGIREAVAKEATRSPVQASKEHERAKKLLSKTGIAKRAMSGR